MHRRFRTPLVAATAALIFLGAVALAFYWLSGLAAERWEFEPRSLDGGSGSPAEGFYEPVDSLIRSMTLQQKIAQLHGIGQMRATTDRRLGIRSFQATDGPRGVGEATWRYLFRHLDRATAFPVSLALASTWDPDLAFEAGAAIAREARAKGRNWLFAPCINIVRDPRGGRTQESFGEDPHLTSRIAVGFIRGVQSERVMATAKHFVCNNQETGRHTLDVTVGERALREIYLPAFRAAVREAGVATVMAAYNAVNGTPSFENHHLLTEVLREEWGFEGVVVSDFGSVLDGSKSLLAGLDVEMPKGEHYALELEEDLRDGRVPLAAIERSVRRVLGVKLRNGLLSDPRRLERTRVGSRQHRDLALDIARQSIVLLKNRHALLPLDRAVLDSVAVLGPNADVARLGDSGSSEVRPFATVSPLEGLRQHLGTAVTIHYQRGSELEGEASPQAIDAAAAAAAQSDVALIFVGHDGTFEGERIDRRGNDLKLPAAQIALIEAVLDASPRVVVVHIGGVISMSGWSQRAAAVLSAWYPGEQGGRALAEVLFGDVNPSGRLPVTFPRSAEDLPAFPDFPDEGRSSYDEGIFVGYRHFDRYDIEPLFPFGHGLGYTEFSYQELALGSSGSGREALIRVRFTVRNSGDRAGTEVAQIYVRDVEARVEQPERELGAFRKLRLGAGESRNVELELGFDQLAFFDIATGAWKLEAGDFEILVGSSSRDTRLSGTVHIREGGTER